MVRQCAGHAGDAGGFPHACGDGPLHPHAKDRLVERGAFEAEVISTIEAGETFPARFGRTGFRRNFHFGQPWRGKVYATKQVEVYAVKEGEDWLAISVVTRYF